MSTTVFPCKGTINPFIPGYDHALSFDVVPGFKLARISPSMAALCNSSSKEALTMIHLKTQTVAIPEQGPSVFSHKDENPP